MSRSAPCQHGLTLIEVLVAVSLLAVIGLMAWRGLDAIRYASTNLTRQATRFQQLDMSFERLGRDVTQAMALGEQTPWVGERSNVRFFRLDAVAELPRSVEYRWQSDGRNRWEILPGAGPAAQVPQAYTLLDEVKALQFSYMDKAGAWRSSWPPRGLQTLPRAIKVELQLQDAGRFERIFDVPAGE